MPLERIDVLRPERAERLQPRIHFLERPGIEPIDPTLGVDARLDEATLAFEIEGELWGQPLPTRLYLKSEIDLEDGSMTVIESSDPGTA